MNEAGLRYQGKPKSYVSSPSLTPPVAVAKSSSVPVLSSASPLAAHLPSTNTRGRREAISSKAPRHSHVNPLTVDDAAYDGCTDGSPTVKRGQRLLIHEHGFTV